MSYLNVKAFRIYTKSRYLNLIKEHTFVHQVCGDVHPPLMHYGIVRLNHIVNIVTTVTPSIIEIGKPINVDKLFRNLA